MPTVKSSRPRKKIKSKAPETPELSAFESLPSELLLEIFWMSGNVNMLYTTNHLHGLVSFNDVRRELTRKCCSEAAIEGRRLGTAGAQQNLKLLLQEPWLTLHLLRVAAHAWAQELVRENSSKLQDGSDGSQISTSTVKRVMANFRARLYRYRIISNQCRPFGVVPLNSIHKSFYKPVHYDHPVSGNMGFAAITRMSVNESMQPMIKFDTSKSLPMMFIQPLTWHVFPKKFLTGPWTHRQGAVFSYMLLSIKTLANGSVNKPTKTQLGNMRAGINRAIEEECLPALLVFAGEKQGRREVSSTYLTSAARKCRGQVLTSNAGPWLLPLIHPEQGFKMPADLWNEELKTVAGRKATEIEARKGLWPGATWEDGSKDAIIRNILREQVRC